MKKMYKKIMNVVLATVLLSSTFVLATAQDNAEDLYSNDDITVKVEKKKSKDATESEIKIQLESKKDDVEITNIVFPDISKAVADDLTFRNEPEETDEKNTYTYTVNENGEYEFLVNYSVTMENEVVQEDTSETTITEDEPTEEANGVVEEQEPQIQEDSVIKREETHRFKVKVDEIEDIEEVVEEPVTEVVPKVEEPIVEDPIIDESEPEEITNDGENEITLEENAEPFDIRADSNWTQTNDRLSMTIQNFGPNTDWMFGETRDIAVTVDFGDEYKDSPNKEISFKIAPGLRYVTYSVKGTPRHNAESPIMGINDSLVKKTEGQSPQPIYNSVNGEVKYELEDTGVKSITLVFTVQLDTTLYSREYNIIDGIHIKAKVGGNSVGMIKKDINSNGDAPLLLSGTGEEITALKNSNTKIDSKIAYLFHGNDGSTMNFYFKEARIVKPLPKEIKKENISNMANGCVFNEDEHAVECITKEFTASQSPWASFKIDTVGVQSGTYTAEKKLYAEYIDYTGEKILVESKTGLPSKIVVLDQVIDNKLEISNGVIGQPTNQSGIDYKFPIIKISNDNMTVKTDQYIELDISETYEIKEVGFPYFEKNNPITKIEYKIKGNSEVKVAQGDELINTQSQVGSRLQTIFTLSEDMVNKGQFITNVKVYIGDVPTGYTSSSYDDVRYFFDNSIYVLGKLKEGETTGSVKIKSYSEKDSVIDPNSIVEKTFSTNKVGYDETSFEIHQKNSSQITAGKTLSRNFHLQPGKYYYSNNASTFNPVVYLKKIPGTIYTNIRAVRSERPSYALEKDNIVTSSPEIRVKDIKSLSGEDYLEITIEGEFGRYVNGKVVDLNILFDLETSYSSSGVYHDSDYFHVKFPNATPKTHNAFSSFRDNTFENGVRLQNAQPGKTFTIVSAKALFVESSITKNDDTTKIEYDGTKDTAIEFTVADKMNYFVDIVNHSDADVDNVTGYIPVPREGVIFGTNFQDQAFPWNLKIDSAKIVVTDKNGVNVTDTRGSNYKLEYASIKKGSESSYQNASYTNTFKNDTSMIRVTNVANIPDGESVQVQIKYTIDENAESIEKNPEKLNKVLEFNPYLYYVGGGSNGSSKGSKTGSYLAVGLISGKVFIDKNYDGKWNSGEEFLANVKVKVIDENGTEVSTATTKADGSYVVENLKSGSYTVDFTDATTKYPYFTFQNKHTGVEIGSVVPNSGADTGIIHDIDAALESSANLNVGVLDYNPNNLVVGGNNISVREPNAQTPATSDTIVPTYNNSLYVSKLQETGYPQFTISDPTIASINATTGLVTGIKAGSTTATITTKDIFGNEKTGTVNITVNPNHIPTIQFAPGKESLFIQQNGAYDASDGVLIQIGSSNIPITDSRVTVTPATIDTSVVGVTKVTYRVEDNGNFAEKSRLVAVTDGSIVNEPDYFIQAWDFNISTKDVASTEPLKKTQAIKKSKAKAWDKNTQEIIGVEANVTQYTSDIGEHDIRLTPGTQTSQSMTIKAKVWNADVNEIDDYDVISKHGYVTSEQVTDGVITKANALDYMDVIVIHKYTGQVVPNKAYIGDLYDVNSGEGSYAVGIRLRDVTGQVEQKIHVLDRKYIKVTDDYALYSNDLTYGVGTLTTKMNVANGHQGVVSDAKAVSFKRLNNNAQTVNAKDPLPEDKASRDPYDISFVVKNDTSVEVDAKLTIIATKTPLLSTDRTEFYVEVSNTADKPNKENVITDFGLTAVDGYDNSITDPAKFEITGLDAVDFTVIKAGGYELTAQVKDIDGTASNTVTLKYIVRDTTDPILDIEKKVISYSNTLTNPTQPTLSDLEASGIFGDITKKDNNNASTNMPLISDDYDSVKMTQEGQFKFKVYIKDAVDRKSNEVEITVNVTLYDDIDEDKEWGINAISFNAQFSEVQTPGGIIGKAKVEVYDISEPVHILLTDQEAEIISSRSALPIGENQNVSFTVRDITNDEMTSLSVGVKANVYGIIKDGFAMNAQNITAQVSEVDTAAKIRVKAGAEVFAMDPLDPNKKPTKIPNATILVQQDNADITKLNAGLNQEVTFIYEDVPTVKLEVNADVYDQVNGNFGIIAENFRAELAEVQTEQNIANKANTKVYNITSKEEVTVTNYKTVPNKLQNGLDIPVEITSPNHNLKTNVLADIYDVYNGEYGLNAKDSITTPLTTISEQKLLDLSEAKAWKYENGVRIQLDQSDISALPVPTTVGDNQDVTYTIIGKGVSKEGIVNVVKSDIILLADKNIVLSVADAKLVDEADLLGRAHASAKIGNRTLFPTISDADVQKIKAVTKGSETPQEITVSVSDAQTGDHDSRKVNVYVVDAYDPTSKIGLNAHDFAVSIDDISLESYVRESEVEAFDFNNFPSGNVEKISKSKIIVRNLDAMKKETGRRDVYFEASSGNRTGEIKVDGHVFDHIEDGIGINAKKEFNIAKHNVNAENLKSYSGVRAWYIVDLQAIEELDTTEITISSPTKLPETAGDHMITFKAEKYGKTASIQSKAIVSDTNIKLEVNPHIALTVDQAQDMTEANLKNLIIKSVELSGDTVTSSIEDMTVINNVTEPTTNAINVTVIVKADKPGDDDQTKRTVQVYVFDEIDTHSKLGINAHNFVLKLEDVNETNMRTKADAEGFNLEYMPANPPVKMNDNTVTVIRGGEKVVGDREVEFKATFDATRAIQRTVRASVVGNHNPDETEGINAHNFTIGLKELSNERILEKSGAQRVIITEAGHTQIDDKVKVIAPNPLPNEVGTNIDVTLESENGVKLVVKMDIVDTRINLEAHDSIVIQHSDITTMTDTKLLGLFDAKATLDNQPLNPTLRSGDLDALKALTAGQEAPVPMRIEVSAPSGDATHKDVNAYVVDVYNPTDKIGMNAHDFKAQVNEINREKFMNYSGVKAYDFGALPSGQPKSILEQYITVDPAALANKKAETRDVKFTTAFNNRTAEITVKGHIFDVIDGHFAFKLLPKFEIALNNVDEDNFISGSGIQAWYVEDLQNQISIPTNDISVTSEIKKVVGEQDIDFKAVYDGKSGAASSIADVIATNITLTSHNNIAMSLTDAQNIKSHADYKSLFGVEGSSTEGSVSFIYKVEDLDAIAALTKPNTDGINVTITAKSNTSQDTNTTRTRVYVYDVVDGNAELAMNGHDFVIKLKDLTNSNIKRDSEVGAWNLEALPQGVPTRINLNNVEITAGDDSDQSLGDRPVSFRTDLGGIRVLDHTVQATVVDGHNPEKTEGINAHDFTIALNELSSENILKKSGAERVVITKPGDSSIDDKVSVLSPQPVDYPTEAKNSVPVVLVTENGFEYTVYMKVVDTNITLNADPVINIQLSDVANLDKTEFLSRAHVSATHNDPSVNLVVSVDEDKLTEIRGLSKAPETEFEVKVSATVDTTQTPKDTTSKIVKVRVYDVIKGDYGMRADNITAKFADVQTKRGLYNKANIRITKLSTNTPEYVSVDQVIFAQDGDTITSLPVGLNQDVTIIGPSFDNIMHNIKANVYDDYDPNTDLGIIAHDFIAKEADVDTMEKVVTAAQTMVYDGTTGNPRADLEVTTPNAPLKVGKRKVHFKHDTLNTTSTGDIYNEHNPGNKETMNAHDFAIALSELNDKNVRNAAEADAFTVNADGTTTKMDRNTIIVSALPTEIGNHPVTFSTEKGTSYQVTAYVYDKVDPEAAIGFRGHDFDIKLEDVSISEYATRSEIEAFDISKIHEGVETPLTPKQETELPNTTRIDLVRYSAKLNNKTSEYTVKAHVYNVIAPDDSEGMNAHDFAVELKDFNVENVKTLSEVEAYTLHGDGKNTPIHRDNISVSVLPNTTGEHDVTFKTQAGTEITVTAYVYDKIDPVSKIGFTGHDFDIRLEEVDASALKTKSEIKAFDIRKVEAGEVSNLPVKLTTEVPTRVGVHDVTYEAKLDGKTSDYTIKAHVYNVIATDDSEGMNAHDFAVELKVFNEANVKTLSGLEAYTLHGNGKNTIIDLDTVNVSSLPNKTGTHPVTFKTQVGTEITVQAHVYDKIDHQAKIGFTGHNFDIKLDEVSVSAFKTKSEIKAYDITKVEEGIVKDLQPKLKTELPEVVGDHDVQYSAKLADKTAVYDLVASVYNHIDPDNSESINAHDFAIELKDFKVENVKTAAGLEAFILHGNGDKTAINRDEVDVSTLPTTIGTHDVTFTTQAGTNITVKAHVYDYIDEDANIGFTGHNFDIELKKVSEPAFKTKSEIKAYDISKVTNSIVVELTPKLESALPKIIGNHGVEYSATREGKKATYDLRAFVYNVIATDDSEAMNAHSFAIALEDFNEANVKIASEVEAFTLHGHGAFTPIDINDISVSPLPNKIGTHEITFTTIAGTQIKVNAYVYDQVDHNAKIAFNGHNFDVELGNVSAGSFKTLSEIKAYDITEVKEGIVKDLETTLETALPTVIGKHDVQYSAKLGTKSSSYDLKANVYNHIDSDKSEAMNAHDFAIELKNFNEANVKTLSEVSAVTLLGNGESTPIALNDISVSDLPQTVGVHEVTFSTQAGTKITVKAHVYNKIDDNAKIGFIGHDFDIELKNISIDTFKKKSEIQAFDIKGVNQGTVTEIETKLETVLPEVIGTHDVKYSASVDDRASSYDLKAFVYDVIAPDDSEAMNAHDFVIKLKDVNAENLKKGADLEAYTLLGNGKRIEIEHSDLTVTPVPNTTGVHAIIFETAAKTKITVNAYVVDSIDPDAEIAFIGQSFDIELKAVSEEAFKAKSGIRAFDISQDTIKELEPKLETALPTRIGNYDVRYSAKADNRTSNLDIKANVFDVINPDTTEAINAHDFAIKLSDVNEANVKALAEVAAYTLHSNGQTTLIPVEDIQVSTLPNSTGKHTITFKTAHGTSISVIARVFDNGEVVPGKDGIYANNFSIGIHELSENTVKEKSGVYALDYSVKPHEEIGIDKISVGKLPSKPGKYPITFSLQSGTQVTVDMFVTASYKVEGNDFTMTTLEFEQAVKNGTLQETLIKKSNSKATIIETGEEVGPLHITFDGGQPGSVKDGDVIKLGVNYSVDTNLVTQTKRGFKDLFEPQSKATDITTYTESIKLSIVDNDKKTDPDKGKEKDNNKGGGKLPGTGMGSNPVTVYTGLLASISGLGLLFLGKKKKEDETDEENNQ